MYFLVDDVFIEIIEMWEFLLKVLDELLEEFIIFFIMYLF